MRNSAAIRSERSSAVIRSEVEGTALTARRSPLGSAQPLTAERPLDGSTAHGSPLGQFSSLDSLRSLGMTE
jgi:hypothetical protein